MSDSSLPRFFSAAEPHRLAVLKALWPTLTGEALANHCEVVGMQDDVMRVRADSPSWLKTLRDLRGTLILRLQRAAGPLAPRALAFVEGPITVRAQRRRATPSLVPVEMSALPTALLESIERIPTEEGRVACLKAMTAFKARFRDVTPTEPAS
ncbi:MAG: DUF721 domain-containing protein [Vicinamibacteria bacterium]